METPSNISLSGGDHWKTALKVLTDQGCLLKVGVLEGTTGPNGLVAPYAFFNEYGAGGIPSRPFMRETIRRRDKAWAHGFAEMFRNRSTEPGIVRKALSKLGETMEGDIVAMIRSNMPPPNSPETLLRKNPDGDPGKSDTLIDKSGLVNGIKAVVEGE